MNFTELHTLEQKVAYLRTQPLSPDGITAFLALAALLKTFNPTRAIDLANEVIAWAHPQAHKAQVALAWAIRAYSEAQLERVDTALECAQMAWSVVDKSADYCTLAYIQFVRCYDFCVQTRFYNALEAGLQGIEYARQCDELATQANLEAIILVAYSGLEEPFQAEAYGAQARTHFEQLGDMGGQMLVLNNLAMHFYWHHAYSDARHAGEQLLALWRTAQSTQHPFTFSYALPTFLHTIADIAIAQDDLDAAEHVVRQGFALPVPPILTHRIYLLFALGKVWGRQGKSLHARTVLLWSLRYARTVHRHLLVSEIVQELSRFYHKRTQYAKAFYYAQYLNRLEQARCQEQLVAQVRALRAEYEARVAQREVDLLTAQNSLLVEAYAELHQAHLHMRELSIRDGLTQLYNRPHFETWSQAAFDHAVTEGSAFGILLCDIDSFKVINDTWLHHIGDQVLQIVAALWAAACPVEGLAARYGGDEFVMALANVPDEQLYTIAENFRVQVERYPWHSIAAHLHITVSIGASGRSHTIALEQQIVQADINLYTAKRRGKNRVQDSLETPPDNPTD